MGDRVYPGNYSPDQTTTKLTSENINSNMVQSQGKPPPPPTGTYVIQIPKDQIYIIPPPENARRYEKLSRKNTRVSSSQSDLTFSPEFDVTVRAQNPNSRIGIYYEKWSNVSVSHTDTNLCSGLFGMLCMINRRKKSQIPLGVNIKVPARVKVGSVRTWKFTVRVRCDVIVAVDSKIVSKKCSVDLKFWKN
ncbi:hypothetical protein MKW98_015962 [Papaver atlanticum]|uniref:Late embryogenesis abundant protein LEA-2 subgroup domain-containing protein n=1 Tax=Papaver atlanticum TaxID=357466 RepID=A0AAD4X374_9MAGN|nr:hypothetical protein MKW98_015962 [Papaver atlanticum]